MIHRYRLRLIALELVRKWRRENDSESRALVQAGALDHDCPAVHFHQTLHNGQSQSQSAVLPGDAAVGLAKPVEDMGQEFRSDSYAGVGHLDFSLSVRISESNFDGVTRRCELDGVVRQIPDHLLKPGGVQIKQKAG